MNDTPDADKFLRVGRLNTIIGVILVGAGVALMLWGKPKDESSGAFISQQFGIALLTAGAIDLLVFTSLTKLKEYLSRDARELYHRTMSWAKQVEDALRQIDGLVAQVDQFRRDTNLEAVQQDIAHMKIDSEGHTRRLLQVQEELEKVRLAVDPEFRELLNGPQGDLLRRARREIRRAGVTQAAGVELPER